MQVVLRLSPLKLYALEPFAATPETNPHLYNIPDQ